MKNQFSAFLILFFLIGFMAYLDSPYSFLNRDYSYSPSEPVIAKPMDQTPFTDKPDIEERLENREKVDGYIVETYREYEIYKDQNGEVTKSVPTSKMDQLKYWDYQQ
ncbi:hypothetical protein [Neobacillus sp. PS3-40]|uniref:hypothetical protein n=1 Tax=Neobacillus sp. PS3-40 TaxID=3070679 RepID=UPI0027DFBC4F|nr:hypothetical protein [Neobacillus sp. PS3-40]WML44822.1 hypothetical protein RCG20_02640 [Neobacillus sp. PS3-40]